MDDNQLSEGIADVDKTALAQARKLLAMGDKLEAMQYAALWKGVISAAKKGNRATANEIYHSLIVIDRYGESREMYKHLYTVLDLGPKHEMVFQTVISTAAAVARFNSGRVPEAMDREWFMKTAGSAYAVILKVGTERCRRYTAEVALNVGSEEVLAAVSEAAMNDSNQSVRKAAGEAYGMHMTSKEIEAARVERKNLLIKYDPTLPQALFIDTIYDAIETILGMKKGDAEDTIVRSAALQLASFPKITKQLDGYFSTVQDHDNLEIIKGSLENALIHALVIGSPNLKNNAVDGLVGVGSDRVRSMLERIMQRELPGSATLLAAMAAYTNISANRLNTVSVLPALRPAHKAPQSATVPARLITRQ